MLGICLGFSSWCPINRLNLALFKKKTNILKIFENALIPQPVDGFWFPTPEMKARDAYVPFLLSKSLNKNEIWELFWDINWKNIQHKILFKKSSLIFFHFNLTDNSEIYVLFSSLDSRNETYASLAFISGVGHKNPSTRCRITAFWKSAKVVFLVTVVPSDEPGFEDR